MVVKGSVKFLVLPWVACWMKAFFLWSHGVRDIAIEMKVPGNGARGDCGSCGGGDIEAEGGVGRGR